MSGSSEGGASVPVSVVQEGHKLSMTGAEREEGGGYSLHVEVPIVYDLGPGRHLLPRHDRVALLPPHQRPR